jgi:hypothetical protein
MYVPGFKAPTIPAIPSAKFLAIEDIPDITLLSGSPNDIALLLYSFSKYGNL